MYLHFSASLLIYCYIIYVICRQVIPYEKKEKIVISIKNEFINDTL